MKKEEDGAVVVVVCMMLRAVLLHQHSVLDFKPPTVGEVH